MPLCLLTTAATAETVDLKYKTYRNWNLVLPQESFLKIGGYFHFPDSFPGKFKVETEGTVLHIDRDADGKSDAKVEGDSGLVTLRGKHADGAKFAYSLRLVKGNAGWGYASSGAALGLIDGRKIRFIDQNNNGRYNDYGKDAMVIGQGKHATFLSKAVNISGKLYAIEISPDGRKLTYTPYAGAKGTLDLTTHFSTKGKLLSAIVQSENGEMAFDVTGDPLEVPTGTYHLFGGRIGLGRNVVEFTKGKTEPMKVEADQTHTVAFGEPVNIDFRYIRQPNRAIMVPNMVSYVGRAGELYTSWTPFGGSPQFEVKDMETGKQIALAIFGGC